MQNAALTLGRKGEDFAADHLDRVLGWRVLARNWRCRAGEVDLIAIDGDTLVVVEVKTRGTTRAGHPLESITMKKVENLRRLALTFLVQCREDLDLPYFAHVRIDAIGILWNGGRPELTHVRNVG